MRFSLRTTASAAALLTITAIASAAGRPPPPTNVRVTQVQGIDRALGAFILEWSPAIDAATGQPYAKYLLSAGCKYEGIDSGAQAGPTGISGRMVWPRRIWLAASPLLTMRQRQM